MFCFYFLVYCCVSNENSENMLMVLNIGAYLNKSLGKKALCECTSVCFNQSKLVDLYFVVTLSRQQVALTVQAKSHQLDSLSLSTS